MQANCIFCKIVAKQVPSSIIAETDDVLVIKDINPKAPIHYLIIPKKHIADLTGLEAGDVALAGQMLLMAKQLAQDLSGSKGFKLLVNNGPDAGQVVFHSHIHFLSGKKFAEF
jgi:histidine triad (HIT) family protein